MELPPDWKGHLVLAAGGLVERRVEGALKLAVILRRRYGEEWALPKGKVEKGESSQAAALREVKEETGCDATIAGFAGSTFYLAGENPKIVLFWFMEERGGSAFVPSEEVERLEWLAPSEAASRLSHPEEKELIGFCYPKEVAMQWGAIGSRIQGFWRAIRRFSQRGRWRRLDGTIEAYQTERTRREGKGGESGRSAYASASILLELSERALQANELDKGWRCLFAAQRMEIFLLDEEELRVKAATIRAEAGKVNEWRRAAIKQLLGSEDAPKNAGAEAVYQAAVILDEHANNQAYKDALSSDHTIRLALLLVLGVAALLELAWRDLIPFDLLVPAAGAKENESSPLCANQFWTLVTVGVFGFTGATFSAALAATDTTKSSRIPEMTTGIRVTLLRIAMGAVSALAVYLLVRSQFREVFSLKETISAYTIFALSFVAGFTERLVLKAVGHLTKESDGGKQK